MMRLARDVAVYAAGRAIPVLGSMVFTLACVQLLSPTEYAHYSLGVLPALVAATFAGGVAGQPMLRYGLQLDRDGRRKALWSLPLASAAAALPLLVAWSVWRRGPPLVALAAFPLVPLLALTDARRSYLVARSRPGGVFWLDTARTGANVLFLVMLWAPTVVLSSPTTALSPVLALSLGALSALVLVRPGAGEVEPSETVSVDARYLRYGIWTAAWLAIATLFPLAERLLLERAHGIEAAGVYAAISDPLTAAVSAGTSVVGNTLWPKLIVAWNAADRRSLRRLVALGSLACVGAGGLVGVAGLVVGWSATGHLGALLARDHRLATVMLGVTTLWGLTMFVHKPLELTGRTLTMFLCMAAAMVVFLPLAVVASGPLGGMGVILAKGAAGVVYIGAVSACARRGPRS